MRYDDEQGEAMARQWQVGGREKDGYTRVGVGRQERGGGGGMDKVCAVETAAREDGSEEDGESSRAESEGEEGEEQSYEQGDESQEEGEECEDRCNQEREEGEDQGREKREEREERSREERDVGKASGNTDAHSLDMGEESRGGGESEEEPLLNSEALIGEREQEDTLRLLYSILPEQEGRRSEARAKLEERKKQWGPWQEKDSWQVPRFDPTAIQQSNLFPAPSESEEEMEEGEGEGEEECNQEGGVDEEGQEGGGENGGQGGTGVRPAEQQRLKAAPVEGLAAPRVSSVALKSSKLVEDDLDDLEAALEARLMRKRSRGGAIAQPSSLGGPLDRVEKLNPAEASQTGQPSGRNMPAEFSGNVSRAGGHQVSAQKPPRKKGKGAVLPAEQASPVTAHVGESFQQPVDKAVVAARAKSHPQEQPAKAPAPSLRHLFLGPAAAKGSAFSLAGAWSTPAASTQELGPPNEEPEASKSVVAEMPMEQWDHDSQRMGGSSSSGVGFKSSADPFASAEGDSKEGMFSFAFEGDKSSHSARADVSNTLSNEAWAPEVQEFIRTATEDELRERWCATRS
ncbi:MAG: hypothetical protein SGPRY_001466 [Prymnesium sp.]